MIGLIFQFGNEFVEVRINGIDITFRNNQYAGAFVPIENLRISKEGCLKEFPDLKDREDWKIETIKRFKEKIKKYNNEEERINYIIEDLKKFGYIPYAKQKAGHRVEKI